MLISQRWRRQGSDKVCWTAPVCPACQQPISSHEAAASRATGRLLHRVCLERFEQEANSIVHRALVDLGPNARRR